MASIPPPPRAIGPYRLEELLGRGGMAEVYRARREGPGGFEKIFALKRILPSYARNPTLIQRFETEAKIAGGLDHGNIVHVVDFGEADGEHYLVMEWVDGVPLSTLLRTVAERGRQLPPEVVAHIVSEAAQGLHYAHTRTDAAGRPLSIVHRDVSPQNILLARQGDVKISDFGIAKAADSVVRTEAGIQVGKLCYMAPEQAKGEPLDARADVYALGIVLWECLTMRPLFPREEGGEALRAVLEPKHVAPSDVCATAPPGLDAVVLKALSPNRDDRYPDAGALARDLRVYLHSIAAGFGHGELVQFLEQSLSFGGPPRPAPEPAEPPRPSGPPTKQDVPKPRKAPSSRAIPDTAPPQPALPLPSTRSGGGGSRLWAVVVGVVVLLALLGSGVTVFVLDRGADATLAPAPGEAPVAPTPGGPPIAVPTPQNAVAPQQQMPLSPVPIQPDAPKIVLSLRTQPPGATIVMAGEAVGQTPMDVQAQTQRPMHLALLLRGYEPVLFPGTPEDFPQLSAQPEAEAIVLMRTAHTYGLVNVSCSAVGSARVLVDGRDAGEEPVLVQVRLINGTPVTRVGLDVPGRGVLPVDVRSVVAWGVAELDVPVGGTP